MSSILDLQIGHPREASLPTENSFFDDLKARGFKDVEFVRYYPNWDFATTEVLRSIINVYAHRRSCAAVAGTGPAGLRQVVSLAKDGIQVIHYGLSEVEAKHLATEKWRKDLLFTIWDSCDPVSGEVYELEALAQACAEKKIFYLRVTHSVWDWIQKPRSIGSNEGWIVNCGSYGAFGVLGSRYRVDELLLGKSGHEASVSWSLENPIKSYPELNELNKFFKQEGLLHPRSSGGLRDRTLICFSGVDAHAVLELGAKEGQLVSEKGQLIPLAGCEGAKHSVYAYLLDKGWAVEELRSGLLVSAEWVRRQVSNGRSVGEISAVFQGLYRQVKALQGLV